MVTRGNNAGLFSAMTSRGAQHRVVAQCRKTLVNYVLAAKCCKTIGWTIISSAPAKPVHHFPVSCIDMIAIASNANHSTKARGRRMNARRKRNSSRVPAYVLVANLWLIPTKSLLAWESFGLVTLSQHAAHMIVQHVSSTKMIMCVYQQASLPKYVVAMYRKRRVPSAKQAAPCRIPSKKFSGRSGLYYRHIIPILRSEALVVVVVVLLLFSESHPLQMNDIHGQPNRCNFFRDVCFTKQNEVELYVVSITIGGKRLIRSLVFS